MNQLRRAPVRVLDERQLLSIELKKELRRRLGVNVEHPLHDRPAVALSGQTIALAPNPHRALVLFEVIPSRARLQIPLIDLYRYARNGHRWRRWRLTRNALVQNRAMTHHHRELIRILRTKSDRRPAEPFKELAMFAHKLPTRRR